MQCFACDAKHWKHKQHVPCVLAADNNNDPLSIKKHRKKEVSRWILTQPTSCQSRLLRMQSMLPDIIFDGMVPFTNYLTPMCLARRTGGMFCSNSFVLRAFERRKFININASVEQPMRSQYSESSDNFAFWEQCPPFMRLLRPKRALL